MQQNADQQREPGRSRFAPDETTSAADLGQLHPPGGQRDAAIRELEIQLCSTPFETVKSVAADWLRNSKIIEEIAKGIELGLTRQRTAAQSNLIESLILVCPSASPLCFEISKKTGTGEEISHERHKLLGHVIFFYELVDYDPGLAEDMKRLYDGEISCRDEVNRLSGRIEHFFQENAKAFPSVIGFMLMRQTRVENKSGAVDCLRGIFKPYFEMNAGNAAAGLLQSFFSLFSSGKADKAEQRFEDIKENRLTRDEYGFLRRLVALCNSGYIQELRNRDVRARMRNFDF